MNEMENLYEEFKSLRDEVLSKNYDVEGAFELRKYRHRFTDLHRRNLELQSKMRESDVDVEELRQVLNLGDRMWYELGEVLKPMDKVIDIKMALGKQMADERIHIKAQKEKNLAYLKTQKNRLRKERKALESITDPASRAIREEHISSIEATIQRCKELDEDLNKRYIELGEIMMIAVVRGGIVPSLEDIKADTEGLTDEEADKKAKEMEEAVAEKLPGYEEAEEEDKEKETTEPVDTESKEATVEPEVKSEETATTESEAKKDEEAPEVKPEETATTESETKPAEDLGGVDPITPIAVPTGETTTSEEEKPVPELTSEPTGETSEPTTTEEPTSSEETELPVPAFPGEDPEPTTTEESEPTTTEESEKDEEEDEDDLPHKATVKQPKTKLWQKVQNILKAAGLFLMGAIAVHTGIIVHNNKNVDKTNTDEVEETQTPVPTTEPTTAPTEAPVPTTEPTVAPTAAPAPSAAPAPTATPAPTAAPAPSAAPAPTATPAPTAAPTPAPTATPEQTSNVVLTPGESVYNSETGVEVGYNGNAGLQTEAGYVPQENRQLTSVGEKQVEVTENDLKPDATTPDQTLPRTGQEISEDKAREIMTEGEKQNLDDATKDIDWESFFNDGPSL